MISAARSSSPRPSPQPSGRRHTGPCMGSDASDYDRTCMGSEASDYDRTAGFEPAAVEARRTARTGPCMRSDYDRTRVLEVIPNNSSIVGLTGQRTIDEPDRSGAYGTIGPPGRRWNTRRPDSDMDRHGPRIAGHSSGSCADDAVGIGLGLARQLHLVARPPAHVP